jgi:hypothetical protein
MNVRYPLVGKSLARRLIAAPTAWLRRPHFGERTQSMLSALTALRVLTMPSRSSAGTAL